MSRTDKMKSLWPGSIAEAVARFPPAHHSRCTPMPGMDRKPASTGRAGTETSYTRTPALNSPMPSVLSASCVPKYCALSRYFALAELSASLVTSRISLLSCRCSVRVPGGGGGTYATGRGRRGSRTSTTLKPPVNGCVTKAWPRDSMTCSESDRPAISQVESNCIRRLRTAPAPVIKRTGC
jgi:hypothetical protein